MLLYLSPKAQKLFDHVPVTQVMVECYFYQYFLYTLKDLLNINHRRPSVVRLAASPNFYLDWQ